MVIVIAEPALWHCAHPVAARQPHMVAKPRQVYTYLRNLLMCTQFVDCFPQVRQGRAGTASSPSCSAHRRGRSSHLSHLTLLPTSLYPTQAQADWQSDTLPASLSCRADSEAPRNSGLGTKPDGRYNYASTLKTSLRSTSQNFEHFTQRCRPYLSPAFFTLAEWGAQNATSMPFRWAYENGVHLSGEAMVYISGRGRWVTRRLRQSPGSPPFSARLLVGRGTKQRIPPLLDVA